MKPDPGYLRHAPSNRGYARFGGRGSKPTYFPGPHGSPQSRAAYAAALAEWRAGVLTGIAPGENATVRQVLAAWVGEAGERYRKFGRRTSEWYCHAAALRPVRELYADLPARDFGPRQLAAVRQRMVEAGWSRRTVNGHTNRVRTAWRWAESQGLVPAGATGSLATLAGLRAGRTTAREKVPRRPVTVWQLLAVLRRCCPAVAAVLKLQWLLGCRPEEVCALRPCDLDRSGALWGYAVRPEVAKVGQEVYYLGPRAQRVLGPFLGGDPKRPAFGVRLKQYRRNVGDCCDLAGLPRFVPHALRHNHATRIADRYGIEAAAQRLNHSDQRTTRIYTGQARGIARRVARECG